MHDESPPLLTFLFSDIEGSTRLWEEQPGRMQPALARHDAIARRSVENHHGRVVKTTGDGIHAVFEDAADAVAAALQLQLALEERDPAQGLQLRVRCGLHLGATQRRDGDYYGSDVNRAARIMSIAHGGQTLLSQALADRAAERLPEGASLLDLGRVRLRDLSSPERVFQLQHPLLRATFPPLRSLEATPNNLAQQLNSFVGRERELAEVRNKLGTARLLTLLGMGGIGKSRLSVQLGAEVMDDYPDGVWLVELAPLTDPGLVPQAVASVVGVKEEAGQGVTEALLKYVADKQLLFILDNCEHVVHACALLSKQLLQAGARVTVLASSRDVLQVAGEITYQVPTLSAPDPKDAADPETMTRHEAVRLFVDRATAAQPAFRLDARTAVAVADICHRLDGIPLALELAAARTRALSVEAIAARLSDRFRLLVSGDQTVLPRQRTLRALIDWSHDLLPEAERLLFHRLAVFAGGWTMAAAEAVCAGDGLDALDVLDLLSHLVEKSLVIMDASGERYRMLETVRQYAQEKLEAPGEAAPLRTQHLAHYLAYAEGARPALAGPDQGLWLARLDLERENFLGAHAWSEHAADGDTLAVRLLHALRPYWANRGNFAIGLRLAEEILQRPGLAARDDRRVMALFGAGQMSMFMGRHEHALARLSECLAIAREIDNPAIVVRVLQPLGATCLALNDFAAAREYLDEAVTRARALQDQRELATSLNALAMLYRSEGRLQAAEPIFANVVALARELGDQQVVGLGLISLAMLQIGRGAGDSARTVLAEVLDLAEETGSQQICQSALDVCAGLAALAEAWADMATFCGAAEAQQQQAALRRDAPDAAFLAPLVARARAALGAAAFERHEAEGRQRQRPELPGWMRQWLAATG